MNNITEKIDNYINESKIPQQLVKKAITYVTKKYPNSDFGVAWFDGKKYYQFEFEFGGVGRERSDKEFEQLGIGNEEEWESETDKGLAKTLGVKKAWILEL